MHELSSVTILRSQLSPIESDSGLDPILRPVLGKTKQCNVNIHEKILATQISKNDINFNSIFYLTQYIQSIIYSTCNHYNKTTTKKQFIDKMYIFVLILRFANFLF